MTKFESAGKVAIAGFHQSQLTRSSDVPLGALTYDVCAKAIADAGLSVDDIDGVCTASLLPSFGAHGNVDGVDIVTANWLAERLQLDTSWISGYAGWGTITGALIAGVSAVASGAAKNVLLYRALSNPKGRYHENPLKEVPGEFQWFAPHGMWGPPAFIALPYAEYMNRYGATREAMATLIVQIRENVQGNPLAYWNDKPLTKEEYIRSSMVADPISVLDCDMGVNGAAAFILTSGDHARDLPNRPVYVAGFAQGVNQKRLLMLDDIMDGGRRAAKRLWASSALDPKEVDVLEVYDGFSPLAYWWLECLGYCDLGEAHQFIQGGTIASDGPYPILSGGGSLGNGRLHGVPQVRECYLQLSGRAGSRQRESAAVGLACHAMPHAGGAVVFTSERR